MKFYLASSFDLASLCETTLRVLNSLGHTVPDVWWNVRTKDAYADQGNAAFYGSSLVQSIAARHWRTLQEVDAVILISNLSEPRSFTGANVEVGYALGLGKPVFSLGQLKRSAMYVPVIQCAGMDDLMEALRCFALEKR